MSALTSGVASFVRKHFRGASPDSELKSQWKENGYIILRQAVAEEDIDVLNADIAQFRATCGETKDEFGFGRRIGLFHTQNANSLRIALNPRAQEFLRWAFQDDPLLFGSLTFEVGTQQQAHNDSIFFYTEPVHCMAGVWTALEDVPADAGPLFYVPGSHTWESNRSDDVWARFPDLAAQIHAKRAAGMTIYQMDDLLATATQRWHEMLHDKIEASGKPRVPVVIRKGDVVIWHALLVHGGLSRRLRQLSRRSMVVHYVGKNSPMWDLNSYFLLGKKELRPERAVGFKVLRHELGRYVQHERPVTY